MIQWFGEIAVFPKLLCVLPKQVIKSDIFLFVFRNDFRQDITNLKLINKWKKVSYKLFEMGEERGEQDYPPRDMPLSVALKMLGWSSNNPVKKALSWFELDFEYGANEDKTSLNNMGFPPEEDFFITDQRGYWTVFSDFYKDFKDQILLKKVVRKIQYSDDGVTVVTSGGEVFTADYALSTFSSGVLGSDLVTFDPPLPDWKREAIFRFRPVYFTKIFLKFPRDFWGWPWVDYALVLEARSFSSFLRPEQTWFLSWFQHSVHGSNRRRSIKSGKAEWFENDGRRDEDSEENVWAQDSSSDR